MLKLAYRTLKRTAYVGLVAASLAPLVPICLILYATDRR